MCVSPDTQVSDITLGQMSKVAQAFGNQPKPEEDLKPIRQSIINKHRAAVLVGSGVI